MLNRPLNVLHITAGNLFGGVEKTLTVIALQQQWNQRLNRSFAVCFTGRLSETLISANVPVSVFGPVRTRYPWQILQARGRLARFIKQNPFDAIICHMAWSLAVFGPAIRRAGLPLIFWMHDVAEGTHWIERLARRVPPDLAVINSQFTADSLSKIYPERTPPHVIIHPPAIPPPARLDAAERTRMRSGLGAREGDAVIIQVGRMEHYKGHELHLDALARLLDVPGWTCWIVGGAQRPHELKYLENLRARATNAGLADRVQFLGERRDVERLLNAADIFCQPNLRGEPFGLVFVEALYAGLPVVATAMGGALEIVDESCGRLAPPGNAAALALVLRELIEDPALRARLGRNGPARAESLSHPDLVLSQLETALLNLPNRPVQVPAAEHAQGV